MNENHAPSEEPLGTCTSKDNGGTDKSKIDQTENDASSSCKILSFQTVSGRVKRPLNAYLLFAREHRTKLKEMNPHLDTGQISTILGYMWHQLAQHQKQYYRSLSQQMKALHGQLYPDYKFMRKLKPKKKNVFVLRPKDLRRAAQKFNKDDKKEKIAQYIKAKTYVPIQPKPQSTPMTSSAIGGEAHNSATSEQMSKQDSKSELVLPSTAFQVEIQPTLVVIPVKKEHEENCSVISDVIAGNRETLARQNPDAFLRSAEELLKCAHISGLMENDFKLHDSQENLLLSAEQLLMRAEQLIDDEMFEVSGDTEIGKMPQLRKDPSKYVEILPKEHGDNNISQSVRISNLLASLEEHRNTIRKKANKQKGAKLTIQSIQRKPEDVGADTLTAQNHWLDELATLCSQSMRIVPNAEGDCQQIDEEKEQVSLDFSEVMTEETNCQSANEQIGNEGANKRYGAVTTSEAADEGQMDVTHDTDFFQISSLDLPLGKLHELRFGVNPTDHLKVTVPPTEESTIAVTPKHTCSHEYSLPTPDGAGEADHPTLLDSPTLSLDFNLNLNFGESPGRMLDDSFLIRLHQKSPKSGPCTPNLNLRKHSVYTDEHAEDTSLFDFQFSPPQSLNEPTHAPEWPMRQSVDLPDDHIDEFLHHGEIDCFLPLPEDSSNDSFNLQSVSVAVNCTSTSRSHTSVPAINVCSTISNPRNTVQSDINIQTRRSPHGHMEQEIGFVLSLPEEKTAGGTMPDRSTTFNPTYGVTMIPSADTFRAHSHQVETSGTSEAQTDLPSVKTLTTLAKLNFGCSATKLHSFRGAYSLTM